MYGELEIKIKWTKNFLTCVGIQTPDFSAKLSRPKFEFLRRLDLSNSGFLELLNFTIDTIFFYFSTVPAAQMAQKQKSHTTKSLLMQDWVFGVG